jgi:hypothetical protein
MPGPRDASVQTAVGSIATYLALKTKKARSDCGCLQVIRVREIHRRGAPEANFSPGRVVSSNCQSTAVPDRYSTSTFRFGTVAAVPVALTNQVKQRVKLRVASPSLSSIVARFDRLTPHVTGQISKSRDRGRQLSPTLTAPPFLQMIRERRDDRSGISSFCTASSRLDYRRTPRAGDD